MHREPVRVMEELHRNIVIGRRFSLKYGLTIDLIALTGPIRVQIMQFHETLVLKPVSTEAVRVVIEDADVDIAISEMDLSAFHPDQKITQRLYDMLWKYRYIFKGVGRIKGYRHKISLKEGTEPIAIRVRRRSPAEQAV